MASILVDGNNVGIASHFANDKLTGPDGRPTGAIFGVVRSLRAIMERTYMLSGHAKMTVAWDSKPTWRHDLLPSYKASRKPDPSLELYLGQIPVMRQIIQALGVNQLKAERYEADDIAGHLCRAVDTNWVLVTNDRDWLQLVGEKVVVWQPLRERYVMLDNFEEVVGMLGPAELVQVKAIAGDKGDDIPGAPGIGDKGALQFLRGEMAENNKSGKPNAKFAKIRDWMAAEDGFKRSLNLVDLRDMDIPMRSFDMRPGRLDTAFLTTTFAELGFNSLLSDFDEFLQPFTAVTSAAA